MIPPSVLYTRRLPLMHLVLGADRAKVVKELDAVALR
jgi:hypothetical protein